MNHQQFANTSSIDDESLDTFESRRRRTVFPSSTELGYAILFVDQDGRNKLLYAPSYFGVTSGHTDAQYRAVCPSLSKNSLLSGITIDDGRFEKSAETFVDVLLKYLESDASTAVWHTLIRRKKPDEFLPFREYGTFEVRGAEVQKLELHPDLDD